jgi:hypothetical protein
MATCDHILSKSNGSNLVPEGTTAECLLGSDHEGNHLCKVVWPIGREIYIFWEYDGECGCPGLDFCGCIIYSQISASEAEQIIKEKGV